MLELGNDQHVSLHANVYLFLFFFFSVFLGLVLNLLLATCSLRGVFMVYRFLCVQCSYFNNSLPSLIKRIALTHGSESSQGQSISILSHCHSTLCLSQEVHTCILKLPSSKIVSLVPFSFSSKETVEHPSNNP